MIVRVPSREYHHIARAMDMGAEGLMLPMVGNVDEVRHIVDSMKYHPMGKRGVALGVAHDSYRPGSVADKFNAANKRTTLFCQIETEEGVENADAMAAIDGVDCLWVGHFDLSVSLGHPRRVRPSRSSRRRSRPRSRRRSGTRRPAAGWCRTCKAGIEIYKRRLRFHLLFRRCLAASGRAGRRHRGAARRLQGEVSAGMADTVPRRDIRRFQEAGRLADLSRFRPGAAAQRARRRDGVPRIGEPAARRSARGFRRADPADPPLRRRRACRRAAGSAVVARFGVGYDTVDVEACTEAGIALVDHAGRRSPPGRRLDHHLHARPDRQADGQGPADPRRRRPASPSAPTTWASAWSAARSARSASAISAPRSSAWRSPST